MTRTEWVDHPLRKNGFTPFHAEPRQARQRRLLRVNLGQREFRRGTPWRAPTTRNCPHDVQHIERSGTFQPVAFARGRFRRCLLESVLDYLGLIGYLPLRLKLANGRGFSQSTDNRGAYRH